ncbi:trimethylamine methyltransferase family protein [Zhaonella formicivorans]|uniref:trimethylamine methyltransferase family protein n=1 Tax=Zhaonella formicivorans TaxID=2528593 RepID=UPI0010E93F9B|nr:trimethylamine methyltransferase family protein [Zhaonella formicivorans]
MYQTFDGGQLRLFKETEVKSIHETTMEILEEVGLKVKSESARQLFREKGAIVEAEIVKIPRGMVEEAVHTAPSQVILYGREEKYDLVLEKTCTYLGTGGTVLYALDLETGEKRKTNTHDVRDIARLVDALENVSFYVINTYPTDVPDEAADINRFYWAVTNTAKHVMGGMYTMKGLKDAIAMAEEIAGGAEQLKERPFVSFITLMVSPLVMDGLYTDFMMEVARKGLPLAIPSEPLAGATSPVTLAGTIALNNAESLAGITLAQLINPGTPVLYGSTSSIMDMSQGFYVAGAIESALINAGLAQMAQYYELPMYGTGGMSDSKINDSQAGYESALTAMTVALSGCNYIHDAVGLLEMCQVFSYEKMVIDNEILGNIFRVMRGVEVNEDTLAYDRLKEIGPGGHFLADPHTVQHVRKEFFFPKVSDRRTRLAWQDAGSPDTAARAHKIVKELLKEHKPTPVAPALKAEIRRTYPEIKGEELY